MRKYILIILFSNVYLVAYNQLIDGIIMDRETEIPIPFASVYFSGTFAGTTSDQDGNFKIDVSENASMPLTISAVGYYSFSLNDFSIGESFRIYLTPKVHEIAEVVLIGKSLTRDRKKNLKLFKQEFLGTTANARRCEIINDDDITFNYGSDNDTLKAFALNPILISNGALGYSITYYLDKFEYYKKKHTIFFTGNIIFNEDLTSNESLKQFYEKRRKYAYSGSRMHFFRALWADDLKSAKFMIKNSENKDLHYKDIVIQEAFYNKFFRYTENLEIYYSTGLSNIKFLKEQVFFDQDGYFDPSGISWEGEMGRQRIADWLPYEYSIKQ